ncbi:hypothetical protein ISCGN_006048 [Ixodes scapularis]
MDDIPNEFLKALKKEAVDNLRTCFNDILVSKEIPKVWKQARVKLLYKGKQADPKDLNAYRRIAIISNVCKLFASIINHRLQILYDKNNFFVEAQNGFRQNRRTSDNLFTLTQAIEMKNIQNSQLFLAFLDLDKAYDAVPHQRLWDKMEKSGLEEESVELLKSFYRGCEASYTLENYKSKPVPISIGLRQGCPLSPTLFNVYINDLLKQLEEEGAGLRLSTKTKDGEEEYTRIPCLAFADDVVLITESSTDMQHMMDICTRVAARDNLKFNAGKTQWMGFNANLDTTFYLQNQKVQKTTAYKYLGVTITHSKEYLTEQEENVIKKSNKLKGVVWHLARHSYNKYSVGRVLWKSLAVPAVTYANDALTYSETVVKCLDRHQYELGRWLLGGSSCTANAAVTGEMGWSTHEIRDARSKLAYMDRLKFLLQESYARRMYYHIRYKGPRQAG